MKTLVMLSFQVGFIYTYAEGLSGEAKVCIQGENRCNWWTSRRSFMNAGRLSDPVNYIPPVDAYDLVSYLVLQTNFYCQSNLKHIRGLKPTINLCQVG